VAQEPEAAARAEIDRLLTAAGCTRHDFKQANINTHWDGAIREFVLNPGQGHPDHLLYVKDKATGVIEAKKRRVTLTGVATHSYEHKKGLLEGPPASSNRRESSFQSKGAEPLFTKHLQAERRSRCAFGYYMLRVAARDRPLRPSVRAPNPYSAEPRPSCA